MIAIFNKYPSKGSNHNMAVKFIYDPLTTIFSTNIGFAWLLLTAVSASCDQCPIVRNQTYATNINQK